MPIRSEHKEHLLTFSNVVTVFKKNLLNWGKNENKNVKQVFSHSYYRIKIVWYNRANKKF